MFCIVTCIWRGTMKNPTLIVLAALLNTSEAFQLHLNPGRNEVAASLRFRRSTPSTWTTPSRIGDDGLLPSSLHGRRTAVVDEDMDHASSLSIPNAPTTSGIVGLPAWSRRLISRATRALSILLFALTPILAIGGSIGAAPRMAFANEAITESTAHEVHAIHHTEGAREPTSKTQEVFQTTEAAKLAKQLRRAEAKAARAEARAARRATKQVNSVQEKENVVTEVEENTSSQVQESTEISAKTGHSRRLDLHTIQLSLLSNKDILKKAGMAVAVGSGVYAIRASRKKAAAVEEERQRRLKRLLGEKEQEKEQESVDTLLKQPPPLELEETSPVGLTNANETTTPVPPLPTVDEHDTEEELERPPLELDAKPALEIETEEHASTPDTNQENEDVKTDVAEQPETTIPAAPVRKSRLRLASMFGRNKSGRETDLNVLVAPNAKAPQFAKLLAKLLAFGAPGRFTSVDALGASPLGSYNLTAAERMLNNAQTSSGLSKEDAAEIFANVVNCMLIEIVDLASSSLKEKDSQVTVDAIGVVVDFMAHAASLYQAIAEDVEIKPVTYGGSLGAGQLEQMYSAYAASGLTNIMMGPDEEFEERTRQLRVIFRISEKKAEGLLMKVMQQKLMEAMKGGNGMEEMMKGFGGNGQEPPLGFGGGEIPSLEMLKEMLLSVQAMRDTAQITREDLMLMKEQIKKNFGMSLEELISQAAKKDENSSEGRDLIVLMDSIFGI